MAKKIAALLIIFSSLAIARTLTALAFQSTSTDFSNCADVGSIFGYSTSSDFGLVSNGETDAQGTGTSSDFQLNPGIEAIFGCATSTPAASIQSISLSINPSTVSLSSLSPGLGKPATSTVTATVVTASATNGYFLDIQRNSATSTLAVSSWSNSYLYRRTITANASLISPVSSTALTSFPMLVSTTIGDLAASSTAGGKVQSANGYDIMFTSDAAGTNKLPFETEKYSSSTGSLIDWVNVPTLSSSSNIIYMFYDNSAITTDQSSATGTWNANYQSVYHLKETGSGAVGDFKDSTVNANSSVNTTNQPTATSGGEIDGAQSFDGSFMNIQTGNRVLATSTVPFTVSGWVNLTNYPASSVAAMTEFKTNTTDGWFLVLSNLSGYLGISLGDTDGSWADIKTNNQPSTRVWHYVVATYNGTGAGTISNFQIYLDDSLQTLATSSGYGDTTNGNYIGNCGGADCGWNGILDEIRVSNTVRSADWIATEYNNQSNPGAFATISIAAQNSTMNAPFPDYSPSWAPSGNTCTAGQGNATTTPGQNFSFRVTAATTTASYCPFWWGANDTNGTAMYAGVPFAPQIIVNSTSTASQNGTTTVSVLYRADASTTQAVGNYSGGITITAIANP